jgi:ribosome-associated heat shock protein Hsp15
VPPPADTEPVRIDKWLWAARFLKTRALAADAVKGGRVQVGGERVKPSRDVHVGDRIDLTVGPVRRTVVVLAVSRHRGPASQAALLYEETADSLARRAQYAAEQRLAPRPPGRTGPRPTKRERRRFDGTIHRGPD